MYFSYHIWRLGGRVGEGIGDVLTEKVLTVVKMPPHDAGLNSDEDLPVDMPIKEMYVKAPPRLVRSAWWVVSFDLVLTVFVWGWAQSWNAEDFWENQVRIARGYMYK